MKRLFAGIHWEVEHADRALTVLELDMPSATLRIIKLEVGQTMDTTLRLLLDRTVAVVGVDAKFGWPHAFSNFVHYWTPTQCSYLAPPINELRYRITDTFVRSAIDKLPAGSATECLKTASWIDICKSQGYMKQVDVEGLLTNDDGRPTLIETDHVATLCGLNVVTLLDKMPVFEGEECLRQLMAKALECLKIRHNEEHLTTITTDARIARACLAAITAIIYWCEISDTVDGVTVIDKFGFGIQKPNATQLASAKKEGWIFFPRRV